MPPERSTSMSSMLSAPAHIPAISVVSFGVGFADPDLILGSMMRTFSERSCPSPVCSANRITGTSPANDTRLSSSNTADSAANLCETCTGSAFPNRTDCCLRTPIIPVQRALSSFRHPVNPSPPVERG